MHQFRLAVATRCFIQPLVTSLKSAADLGVKGLQFDLRNELRASELTETGRRDLLHQIKEHGLSVASAVFPLNYPLYEPDKIDVRIAAIRDAMKFAYSIRATTLCIRVGRIPEEDASKERLLLIEALSDLARHANHVGTILAITPTNDSAETLRTLLDEIKTGPIGIDFDPAHFAMTKRSVVDSLRTLHNLVMHVQLRDGDAGIEGGQEEAVGQGNVDWIEVLALLGEMDYRGWLTSIRTQGSDPGYDMVRGIKFIRKILISH
jgi:sugar phosphate isomerase/epimerase